MRDKSDFSLICFPRARRGDFYNFFPLKLSASLRALRNSVARGRKNGNAHARRRVEYAVKVAATSASPTSVYVHSRSFRCGNRDFPVDERSR